MLKIENLTKYYDKLCAVKDLSLEVKDGEIFGFIGPNGAGKSTTIKCIMNYIEKTEGVITIDNQKLENNDELKKIIGYLPSEVNLYDDLNVFDMIYYSDSFYDYDCIEKALNLCSRLELDLNKKIEDLSFGNLKKLGIILTLMHNPKLIILDEPTSGLDPLMQEEFYKILKEEKDLGNTIFFSSHNLSEVKRVCDRIGIIKEGKLVKVENTKDLLKSDFYIITLETKEKIKFKNIIDQDEDNIKFIYKDDINKLIETLSDINITKLLIEEPSIEEIFMHYYK